MHLRRLLLAASVACAFGEPGLAADPLPPFGSEDAQIIGRVLSFQDLPAPRVSTRLAIIYNPAAPASMQEARTLFDFLSHGVAAGDVPFTPVLISEDALASTTDVDAVLSTDGTDQAVVAGALRRLHIPCLTRHVEQVEQGACTIAISVTPTVSIVLNAANAAADGVRFATAFCMMVRQV